MLPSFEIKNKVTNVNKSFVYNIINECEKLSKDETVHFGEFKIYYDGDGYYIYQNESIICFDFKLKEVVALITAYLYNGLNYNSNIIDGIINLYEKYEQKHFDCVLNRKRIDKYLEEDLDLLEIEHCKYTENYSKQESYQKFIMDKIDNLKN